MVVRNFRTELLLHCYHCGVKSPFYLVQALKCPECGKGIKYVCRMCGHTFQPSDLCSLCRWWICPECHTCGCHYYDKYARIPKDSEAIEFIELMMLKYPNVRLWLEARFERPRRLAPTVVVTEKTSLAELM